MTSNDHGWTPLGHTDSGFTVAWGAIVDERRQCACPRDNCRREATQEDLRCDECREVCRG